ncbi:DNA-directed RNA polymerase I subunit rpa2 [Rhizophlyctis rosea]|nr:DNA-directed RNA polymerase I subunit rpa2 [Rhizophlyctis rosea]
MVRSLKCHLYGRSPKDLVERHEDPEEFGGYFISNGIERLIRLLIVPKRNHPTALVRPSFQNRGPTYSQFGVSMRCVRPDQTSQTITLHYCNDGAVTLRFSFRKNEYMVPVLLVLRALAEASDQELFERLTMGNVEDTFLTDRVELLLKSFRRYSVRTRKQCMSYLGSKFGIMLDSPEDSTESEVAEEFLRKVILVHLDDAREKFDMLIFMMQKLYALVAGTCMPDNPDSPQHQEVLLGGHLFLAIIKEKFGDWLSAIKTQIQVDIRRSPTSVNFSDRKYLQKVLVKCSGVADVGKKLEYFLATGNLVSNTGLDLQQTSGYTIVAEKLNFYRYISHFHSIHRGSFFAELKTTTVRKLLPESWGFLCPVHTPDGSPCGLLNHLSHTCTIVTTRSDVSKIPQLVASLGAGQMSGLGPRIKGGKAKSDEGYEGSSDEEMEDAEGGEASADEEVELDIDAMTKQREETMVSIQLDGRIIGWSPAKLAERIAKQLRHWKVIGSKGVPLDLEIGWVPPSNGGQYPGLFLFSTPARMTRPVKYLANGATDMVGPFEQVYMDIACLKEDVIPGLTTHIEFTPTDMLSVVANMTPFSDFNQSPRNMYQCQMGKQAMGTPTQNFPHRTDNKLYRLQTGQTPVVRPTLHDEYGLDGYPNGMNAVVCVISYTGYDMEDASILNKSAHERGYGYGTVYKGEWVDLGDYRRRGEPISHHFGFIAKGSEVSSVPRKVLDKAKNFLDMDGLPIIGVRLKQGDPMYAYVDDVTGKVNLAPYKGMEDAYVDEVRLLGSDSGDTELQRVHIKLRIPRPPVIGDKFSSRHGQKGVISQKWPTIDMPFSESGIVPDVIINPHAFPSRMTIGMFVESLAGKAGALHGRAQDATPFKFDEDHPAADFFGEELAKAGFNYHGNEPMYSGITGQEFKADIYIGVVYYQRLRHMVSDKYQVRTIGPVHNLTQQPIKGRKRAGGIRFGEMERDSLLAHGVSFLLQDRLMNCSDYSQAYVCRGCGNLLSPQQIPETASAAGMSTGGGMRNRIRCVTCGKTEDIDVIAVPYVFRYLCSELVAMGVKLRLNVK